MNRLNEQEWVKQQYRSADNLSARVALHQRFSTNPESWFGWVFDRLQIQAGQRVLEVGGGHGLLWRENAARLPARAQVLVTDLSPGMVAQAADSLQGAGAFHFAQADAQRLPFAPGVFEVVIANHMLYHVPDRDLALREIKRVLRPGGRLLAATNDEHHMQELRDLAESARDRWPGVSQTLPAHALFPFATALDEVSHHFGQVQLHRYANDLVVTDADALADYLLSGLHLPPSQTDQAAFRAWIREQMGIRGQITIHSATGLIEAGDAL